MKKFLPPFDAGAAPPDAVSTIGAAEQAYQNTVMEAVRTVITSDNGNLDAFKKAATDGGWVKAGAWAINLTRTNDSLANAVTSLPEVFLPHDEWWNDKVYVAQRAAMQSASKWWEENYGQKHSSTEWAAYEATSDRSSFWQITSVLDVARYTFIYDHFLLGANGNNPLAEMTSLGHELVTAVWAAVLSMGHVRAAAAVAAAAAQAALIAGAGVPIVGAIVAPASGAASTIAAGLMAFAEAVAPAIWMLLLSLLGAGIMLAYILPMTPALYWFFAVSRYFITGVMAALGAPIWAIAHLELDGEGMGRRAEPGYVVLLELLVRPVIMVMGLVAGLAVMMLLGKLFALVYFEAVRNAITGHLGGITGLVTYTVLGAAVCVKIVQICMWGVGPGIDQLFSTFLGSRSSSGSEASHDAEGTGHKAGGGVGQVAKEAALMASRKHDDKKKTPEHSEGELAPIDR